MSDDMCEKFVTLMIPSVLALVSLTAERMHIEVTLYATIETRAPTKFMYNTQ